VKILFDQNLSPRLVHALADLYPDSAHVQSVGLDRSSDEVLWVYARDHGFSILSKDEDFNGLSIMRGFPPKILWLQLGNCTTSEVEQALRSRNAEIEQFNLDPTVGTYVIR
jgi:predicted nuclease of predicted toxin-antitoxin system